MTASRTMPRFERYSPTATWGHVYFGDVKVGNAEETADGLYVPQGARNARTLYQCALSLADSNVARTEKQLKWAQRLVSAIADANAEGTRQRVGDSTVAQVATEDAGALEQVK